MDQDEVIAMMFFKVGVPIFAFLAICSLISQLSGVCSSSGHEMPLFFDGFFFWMPSPLVCH